MKKYILEEYVLEGFNASSKAREDVSKFVMKYGFESVASNDKRNIHSKFGKMILAMGIYLKLLLILRKDDIFFLQTSTQVLDGILRIKRLKKFKIIYLIHDVFCVRYDNYIEHKDEIDKEIIYLNHCDYVICHNQSMKAKLIEFGCTTNLVCLEIFDYGLSENATIKEQNPTIKSVVFAGNISKSAFLDGLDKQLRKLWFNVYGVPKMEFQNLHYKGSISANELPSRIEGMYGLVWEGEYVPNEQDNYLKYNNPHKTSMYIVSGLPIVIWSKAAMANFVVNNKIGVVIDSLDDLEDVVFSISDEQYQTMRKNCLELRKKLITGQNLKKALDEVMKCSC